MHYNADILDDYLHGELDLERDAAVHAHLETCTACSGEYDAIAGVRDALRAAALVEEREFPSIVRARVWEGIRNAAPSPLERLRAFWRPALLVPVAAIVALIAYLGVPATRMAPERTAMTAAYMFEAHAASTAQNPLADRGVIVPASLSGSDRTTGLIDSADAATLDTSSGGN